MLFVYILYTSYTLWRSRWRSKSDDQKSIRTRTFGAQDSLNVDNPFDRAIGTDFQEATNPAVEMVYRSSNLRKFERYETEDGKESVLNLPEDGEVVS